MNKLLNISRTDGYPMCAEVLQIIEENSRIIEHVLSGTGIPNNSAVLVDVNIPISRIGRWMFVHKNGQYKIVKIVNRTAPSLSMAKVVLNEVNYGVTNSLDVTYEDVYQTQTASIETAATQAEKWTFYEFSDVFELGIYTNQLPSFEAGLPMSTITNGTAISAPVLSSGCKLQCNAKHIRLKLIVDIHCRAENNSIVKFPIGITGYYPLSAMITPLSSNSANYGQSFSISANIMNENIHVNLGEWLSGLYEMNTHEWRECYDRIVINSEVLI